MAGKDSEDGPSLELPSFGLRRRRRDEQAAAPAPEAPATEPEATRAMPVAVDEQEPAPATEPEATRAMPVAVDEQEPAPAPTPEPAQRAKKVRRRPSLPPLAAAALTGALVGLVLVGLMWAGLESCDFLIGTSSCGGGGVVMWLAILTLVVILGRYLLRWFGLDEAGSTSFLGIGLAAVAMLLFLTNELESPWMALVLPAVSAGTYALSHWVTTAFVDPLGPEHHR